RARLQRNSDLDEEIRSHLAMASRDRTVSPSEHYFAAMGIPVLRGRIFSDRDTANSAPVVIVNASLARAAFGGEDPLGRAVIIGKGYLTDPRELRPRTIVGIAGDTRELGLAYGAQMTAYVPAEQSPDRITRIALEQLPPRWVIRTKGDPLAMTASVRKAVLAADPAQPPADFRSMDQVLAASIAPNRFNMILLGIFAALALALAALGISGLTAYSISLRRREIGLRIALGAGPASVVRSFLWQGLKLCLAGAFFGMLGALTLARFLGSLLFGVPSTDAVTIAGVTVILLTVLLISIYLSASRAARIDPMIALR
ncbi:MAG: FtsX-like permease family protein, partial [Bryobacteraceae bacterium]